MIFTLPSPMRAILLLLILCVFSLPVFAQDAEPPKLAKSLQADLNGDGRPETIRIQARGEEANSENTPVSFTLTVGGLSVSGKFETYIEKCLGFRLVRLDKDKPLRQILVVGFGVSDTFQSFLFEYNGKTLRQIGAFAESEPEITGNGVVYTGFWMGFWKRTEKYARDPRTGVLTATPQPAYAVGVKAKVKTPFALRFDHSATAPLVANAAPDTEIELLLCWNSPGMARDLSLEYMDRGWYLIRTAKGLVGWARLGTFREKVVSLPWAG